jgi:hypothetical protein
MDFHLRNDSDSSLLSSMNTIPPLNISITSNTPTRLEIKVVPPILLIVVLSGYHDSLCEDYAECWLWVLFKIPPSFATYASSNEGLPWDSVGISLTQRLHLPILTFAWLPVRQHRSKNKVRIRKAKLNIFIFRKD